MVKKLAWGAAGLFLVGGLLWYLSGDEKSVKLDDKVHTKQKMLPILAELKLEFSCIYIRNFNVKLVLQEEGKWDEGKKLNMQDVITEERNAKLKQICLRYKDVDEDVLNAWIAQNKNLPECKEQASELAKMYDELLNGQQISHPGFQHELPEKLTRDKYIFIYGALFQTLRYDFTQALKKHFNKNDINNL